VSRSIAEMLKAAGRKVTVIDETKNPFVVADEVARARQSNGPVVRITTTAQRTYLSRLPATSGNMPWKREAATAEVEIVLALESPGFRADGPHHTLAVEEGGPTGYERMYIALPGDTFKEHALTVEDISRTGWLACAGTDGRWDRLFIPPASMGAALSELLKAVGR
jgi:hypothetical protein